MSMNESLERHNVVLIKVNAGLHRKLRSVRAKLGAQTRKANMCDFYEGMADQLEGKVEALSGDLAGNKLALEEYRDRLTKRDAVIEQLKRDVTNAKNQLAGYARMYDTAAKKGKELKKKAANNKSYYNMLEADLRKTTEERDALKKQAGEREFVITSFKKVITKAREEKEELLTVNTKIGKELLSSASEVSHLKRIISTLMGMWEVCVKGMKGSQGG